MKLKFLLLLIAQVAITQFLFAQSKVKTLIKNDIVPAEMSIGKLMNYKSKTAKFSDFRGKLVILDFWNTHCAPCVKELPGMDSLQEEFGRKIAIIPVTRNELPQVQSYFKK
ncbi:TlpA disulfide reductase family protein, partial [Pedobacter sp. MC2016-24]|uniref:TlpA family protein disulfide reductase n=1 Tax=Pedobacter sp. MC2016-24 TaxID=2780090 RepID=UPI001881344D